MRIDADDVKQVINTGLTDPILLSFIEDADAWITANLEGQPECDDAILVVVEKYLTAHLITTREPLLTSASRDDVSESYQRGAADKDYAKLAASFDPTGRVAAAFLKSSAVKFRRGAGYDERHTASP